MQQKPTIRELREKAGLQIRELSITADVSESSINRMERKVKSVSVVLVNKVLRVINDRLHTNYEAKDVDVLLLQRDEGADDQGPRQFKIPRPFQN